MSAGGAGREPSTGKDTVLWVDLPGYRGPLEKLVNGAQRGDIDLSRIPVAEITGEFRRRVSAGDSQEPSLTEVADFLTLAARLVALKAGALLPENSEPEAEEEGDPEMEAGRRLAEYRLFTVVVDSLLSDADEGYQSFLGLVAPEVVPVERLRVPPARLLAALRSVVERLAEEPPLPLGLVTFSVAEMATRLRGRLAGGATLAFEELFAGMTARLEVVACFLALLELLSSGDASVEQPRASGPILVTGRA
ncbi:MAG: ScpA family protein [Candidatus Dormibacteria bacterium]